MPGPSRAALRHGVRPLSSGPGADTLRGARQHRGCNGALPTYDNLFVGRSDIPAADQWVREGVRLISLTGPPGGQNPPRFEWARAWSAGSKGRPFVVMLRAVPPIELRVAVAAR
jgi:hypothetical protein